MENWRLTFMNAMESKALKHLLCFRKGKRYCRGGDEQKCCMFLSQGLFHLSTAAQLEFWKEHDKGAVSEFSIVTKGEYLYV